MNMNSILELLKNNKEFYNKVRIDFTYHSSSIEGSTVSKEDHIKLASLKKNQTLQSLQFSSSSKENDLIENYNCLRLFDYVFKNIDEKLTHEVIQRYQFILKEDSLLHKNVPIETGKYRKTYVKVGSFDPPPHYMVYQLMDQLIKDFQLRFPILLLDICEFHVRYETIHPFRDGNGRTGRMIASKQCLQYNVIPFIVDDITRPAYIDSLYISQNRLEYSYFAKYCVDHQKIFINKYKEYLVENKMQNALLPNEKMVIEFLKINNDVKRKNIEKRLKLSTRTVKTLLKEMKDKGIITTLGKASSTIYLLKNN
jgi:Fic family protein